MQLGNVLSLGEARRAREIEVLPSTPVRDSSRELQRASGFIGIPVMDSQRCFSAT